MRVWVLFGAVHDSAGLALHEGAVCVQFVNDELEGTQDLSFVLRWNIVVADRSAHDIIADKLVGFGADCLRCFLCEPHGKLTMQVLRKQLALVT